MAKNGFGEPENKSGKGASAQSKPIPAFQKKKNSKKNRGGGRASAIDANRLAAMEADETMIELAKKKDTAKKNAAVKESKSRKKAAPAATDKPEGMQVSEKGVRSTASKKKSADGGSTKRTLESGNAKRETAKSSGGFKVKYDKDAKVRIIPLGGLHEIGKNMTAIECGDDIIVIDCGLAFPDEMPGVDLVIPDVTYLEANSSRVRGIVLTHGHEDHIGAIPYVLRNINPPIYGTRLTVGIVRNKLKEFSLDVEPKLIEVKAGDTIRLGGMTVEFIHVNHSIADACALAIGTPLGTIVHSGDFKLDLTPIDGEIMDITRLGELGKEGVLLLMCESTNAERPGSTPSERKVGASMEYIFTTHKKERIVIATFSSNVHRVQQIIDASAKHGRKVAVTGRSMLNIVGAAVELGYMHVPKGVLIDISEIRKYNPEQLTIVTTGSQGEPMSALYRMAFGEHREVQLNMNDVVVISSSAIPGNEKLVGRIINELCKCGVEVIHDAAVEVHVSGHACQEELKLMQALRLTVTSRFRWECLRRIFSFPT